MRRALRLAPPALAILAVLALAVILLRSPGRRAPAAQSSSSSSSSSAFDGAALGAGFPAPTFTLADQSGRAVSLSSYSGRVVVLSFLYSRCGATCILIAQQIRGALDELPRPVPVLIVSADPAADSPASVRRFLASVSLEGRAEYLSGSLAQLRPVWHAYRLTPASAGAAAFDRLASVLLIDGRGDERVLYGQEQLTPESLAHDIRALESG